MKHSYYRECPKCGALLDPGEACNCEGEADRQRDPEQHRPSAKPKSKEKPDLFYDLLAECFSAG